MIAIIDYGAGNIFSVKNALDHLGLESKLVSDEASVRSADAVILPGVGAFPAAMKMLENTGLVEIIKEEAGIKPFLGICLGMQLIFEKSYEFEECDGLGLIEGIGDDEYVYFVHSYKAECEDKDISAYCEYSGRVPALVHDGKYVYGAQFHPEKSGETGLKILKNFGGLIK